MGRSRQASVEIRTEAELERLAANDDYWHNKRVDDAIYNVAAGAIYFVGLLALAGVVYFIWYYQFSDNRNPSVLVQAAAGVLVYVSGLLTPRVKSTLSRRRKR